MISYGSAKSCCNNALKQPEMVALALYAGTTTDTAALSLAEVEARLLRIVRWWALICDINC
jgi:nanoRNase/pAp phosphatase (c-di-AMP/oligoRNAs hydrolase)